MNFKGVNLNNNKSHFFLFYSCLTIGTGAVFSIYSRSYDPLIFLSSIAILSALMNKILPDVIGAISKKKEWDNTIVLSFTIIVTLFAFLAIGLISFIEKTAWEFGSKPIFVAKAYARNYTANDHRLFKMICKAHSIDGPMIIKVSENTAYARCGDFYPNTYMISANQEQFFKVLDETAHDTGDEPVIIEVPPLVGAVK